MKNKSPYDMDMTKTPRFTVAFGGTVSVVSVLVGLAGLYIGIEGTRERHPGLVWELTSQTDLIGTNQAVPGMQVLVAGEEIQQAQLNLRIIRLSLSNAGEGDVLQTAYDDSVPFGLVLHAGQLFDVRVTNASNEYLLSRLQPRISNDSTVLLNRLIFEAGARVELDLFLLHPRAIEPRFEPVGKIAGMNEIEFVTISATQRDRSLLTDVFKGKPLVQVFRLALYGLGLILFVALVAFFVAASKHLVEHLVKNSRKWAQRRLNRWQASVILKRAKPLLFKADTAFLEFYARAGPDGVRTLEMAIRQPSFDMALAEAAQLKVAKPDSHHNSWDSALRDELRDEGISSFNLDRDLQLFGASGIVTLDKSGKVHVEKDFRTFVSRAAEVVVSRGYYGRGDSMRYYSTRNGARPTSH